MVIGEFEFHTQSVAKQLGESLTVCLGQRRFEQGGDILPVPMLYALVWGKIVVRAW
jgi:hypothetical protein